MLVDKPVVEITAVAGECGYVSVSWTATGNSDVCSPVQYNVTLSSSTMNMTVSITSMNTHRFTELPDDTQFTITVIGINVMEVASDPVSTSVTTNCMYVLSYVQYMYNIIICMSIEDPPYTFPVSPISNSSVITLQFLQLRLKRLTK